MVNLWYILNEILIEIPIVIFFLLSSNSVTLLIKIPLTSALRSCVVVAVRGSVWLVVVLVVVLWVWLCVILRESNAHALRIHKTKAKKQTLSYTHKKKNKNGNTQRICCPYTQKKPLTTYIVRLL